MHWNNQLVAELKGKKFAVAISGGADSFALLHMALNWSNKNNAELFALTVDHGLRQESAQEAQDVAAWCQNARIKHQILPWLGDKPQTTLQATARTMRRKLLCKACIENGIDYLLLGHQADDQAETLLMRLQRGSGLKGLRIMQPLTKDKATRIKLMRPLLHVTRMELRQYCLDHRLPFIDDPSNEDPKYERVRMRKIVQQIPALSKGVVKSAERLRRADDTVQKLAQDWLYQNKQNPDTNQLWLPQSFITDLLPELQIRVLEMIVHSRDLAKIEALAAAMQDQGFSGTTLAGFWIKPKVFDRQKGFLFQPEPARSALGNSAAAL